MFSYSWRAAGCSNLADRLPDTLPGMIPITAAEVRDRVTPIPTPTVVRALGSIGVGGSIGVMVSQAPLSVKAVVAVLCVVAAVAATLLHPYRKELRAFAEDKGVVRVPSISMVLPLMLWWLLLMLAPLAHWPAVGAWVAGVVAAAVAWVLYPHVDGSRRLAYA